MKNLNPNFEKHLKETLRQDRAETNTPRPGIIQSYNPDANTATVLMVDIDTDLPGEIMTNVICPVYMGIQMASPQAGRPCWIAFKGGRNDKKAVITNYFNHNYQVFDKTKQSASNNGIPRYLLGT